MALARSCLKRNRVDEVSMSAPERGGRNEREWDSEPIIGPRRKPALAWGWLRFALGSAFR